MVKLELNEIQKKLLTSHGISYNYDNMTDDNLVELNEKSGDLLIYEGLDENYAENEKGHQYRDIIYRILDTEESEKA